LIIQSLPPYAVARLNSDKLEELDVSTKIEVRTDEYKGVMEEDEPAARARAAAAMAVPNTSQRTAHRTPSVSAGVPYNTHQYASHYQQTSRSPMPAQHYPQTPVRQQPQNIYQRPSSAVPIPQPHQVQQRPASTQYRTPNGYAGYPQQITKTPATYGHGNLPQYGATPSQPRMPPVPGYSNIAQAGAPGRYQPGYSGGYTQHQQMHPQHAQQPHPQQGYSPYTNGTAIPPRTMSPHVTSQPHQYSQSPTPPQQPAQVAGPQYGASGQGMAHQAPPRPHQYSTNAPAMPQMANRPSSLTGYHTVMPEVQQQQLIDQARARADAQQRATGFGGKVAQPNEISGLAGINLGGNVDMQKLTAARAGLGVLGSSPSTSSSPRPPTAVSPGIPQGVNGVPPPAPSVSPAGADGFQPPV
jgi:hypothetical protein